MKVGWLRQEFEGNQILPRLELEPEKIFIVKHRIPRLLNCSGWRQSWWRFWLLFLLGRGREIKVEF